MTSTKQEFESFHRFVDAKLQSGSDDLTIEELLDLWRIENPSPEQAREDLLAVKASLRDFDNGERGRSAHEHIQELRVKYGLPARE